MGELEYWKERLRDEEVKWTRQRELIIETLAKADKPLSAKQIFSDISNFEQKLRLSTVYRNLKIFAKKNIVVKFQFNNQKKFEISRNQTGHHHHLLCLSCEEIVTLECPLHEFEAQLSRKTDYDILEHNMKMYGICPKCKD